MALFSTTPYSPSYSSQVEGSPSHPHRSVEELKICISSEIHPPLSTNDLPILVPTQPNDPEPAHGNDDREHPEEITTFATTVIPFSGHAVPTTVVLSLGQYTSSLDQGCELGPFSLSHLSEPSQPSTDYHVATGDTTMGPRFLKYIPSPGGFPTRFPIAARNPIPRPDVLYDYQPSRHVDTNQEPVPDGTPAVDTASPGVTVYPPPFNQTLGGYLVSDPAFSYSLVNRVVTPPSRTTFQTEGSGQPTFRQPGQTDQGTPTLSVPSGPIRGVTVDQNPRRHQCTMCDADYSLVSGLNRHLTEKHIPWMSCDFCDFQYPLGRKYLLTRHLETDHPIA